jgi:hypothetical protein
MNAQDRETEESKRRAPPPAEHAVNRESHESVSEHEESQEPKPGLFRSLSPVAKFVVSALSIGVPISAIVSAIVAVQQWRILNEQNELLRESNRITQQAVTESITASATAVAQNQAHFEASLKQAQDNASAEQKLTRQSNAENRRQFAASQRARVHAIGLEPYPLRASNQPPEIIVLIRNSGQVAATRVRVIADLIASTEPLFDGFEIVGNPKQKVPSGVTVLAPGATRPIKVGAVPEAFSEGNVRALKGGFVSLYLIGDGEYEDGFGTTRRFRFCSVHETTRDGWLDCNNNNWAE